MPQDTISAISTAWGEAGVAIVRLSGERSRSIASQLVKPVIPLDKVRPREMHVAYLLDDAGNALDEVLVVFFMSPKSYTGEEVVEIHTHGGTLIAQICLERAIRLGARLAEPGEFTKRAFLNHRIDLSQAESVIGIIRSRSEEALRAAARTLGGELSSFVSEIREEILDLQAKIEVDLDFPDEATPYVEDEQMAGNIETLIMQLNDLLDRCAGGYLLREGIRVAIVGRPNVGKSSLLNSFLKKARAIVTAIPGTTRDIIEESVTWRGVPIRFVDTAGIREPTNEVEAEGIQKAREEFSKADICLWILDGSRAIQEQDRLPEGTTDELKGISHIFVINKCDLPPKLTEDYLANLFPDSPVISISAKHGTGVDQLKEQILFMATGSGAINSGLNATARQIYEVKAALEALNAANDAIHSGVDIVATCLSQARTALERMLGLSCDDALLEKVFGSFCVGK